MARYQWIKQESAEDCAAASLAIVARHYGRDVRIERVREAVSTDSGGSSLASVRRGAESLGFLARVVQLDPEWIDRPGKDPLPAIVYWKGYHLLVFYGRRRRRYVVSDPALGVRYLTRHEFEQGWQGRIVLLVKPHPVRFGLLEPDQRGPYVNLLHRLSPHRLLCGAVLSVTALTVAVGFGLPLLLQYLVDGGILARSTSTTSALIAGLAAWILVDTAASSTRTYLVEQLAHRLTAGLTLEFGLQLLHLPLRYHQSRSSGLIRNRLGELYRVTGLVTAVLAELPLHFFTMVAGLSILAAYDWRLTAIAAVCGLIMSGAMALLMPPMRQAASRLSSATGETLFLMAQFFSNAMTIRSLGAARFLESQLDATLHASAGAIIRSTAWLRSGPLLSRLLLGLSLTGLLWWASGLWFRHALTPGQLVAVAGVAYMTLRGIAAAAVFALDATEVKAATEFLEDVFASRREDGRDGKPAWVHVRPADDIRCEGLSFQYPARRSLFDKVSLLLPGGRVSAIVGQSGSGKSTLACLLAGLYDLPSGRIVHGEQDLGDLSVECRRKQVVLVAHDPTFLTSSVTDNVRIGAPDAREEDVVAVCRLTLADEFVRACPEGYATVLGDFSARLSAGEKQRLAIARALVLDPPVLILDECTSNLDAATEAQLLDQVLASRSGKTTVLISHRPTVVARAEWVVLLEEGRVGFQGPAADFRPRGSATVSGG